MIKLSRMARRLRELGWADAARWAWVGAEAAGWGRYFGADTEHGPSPGAEHPESIPYEPLPWQLIRRSLDGLALTGDDVFLDYGAGMGRVLLMAAHRGPRRVVGIELMEPLAAAARRNACRAQRKVRSPIEVFVANATTWQVPDDVTAVNLFNPFIGSVMAATLTRIAESLQRRRRPLRLMYTRVVSEPNLFSGCDWLTRTATFDPGVFRSLTMELYEARPVTRRQVDLSTGTPLRAL